MRFDTLFCHFNVLSHQTHKTTLSCPKSTLVTWRITDRNVSTYHRDPQDRSSHHHPGCPGLAEMNLMNPPTLKIQTKHTLAETCANKNVVPKSLNCDVPRFICTSAPLVNTVQGGKKVAMMTSSTMLTCSALVLACFTHDNALCNKEDGALAFEKAVRPFLPWMLLLAHACSSQKIYERPVRAYPWILTKYV
jgi:hypothetical protein